MFSALLLASLALCAKAAEMPEPIHGLWVWKSTAVLQAPQAAQALAQFCESAGVNEVYLSVPAQYSVAQEQRLAQLIALLHGARIQVEALISSANGDEAGGARTELLDRVQSILQFNQRHAAQRFDGVHLDIEPQQRLENKGSGNLGFLRGLVESYRAVRTLTDRAGLTLNADIQKKLLEGDLEQRRSLLASVPRLTLMLYELSSPSDGKTTADRSEKLGQSSAKYLDLAYQELEAPGLAKMAIGLRTPDYGSQLPQMLALLDSANRGNPHYLGWARHSYNDSLARTAVPASP